MNYSIYTLFNTFIKSNYNIKLGRWSLLYDKKKLNRRILLANYDNCGVSKLYLE